MTVLIPLHAAIDRTVSGAKAANLARLMDLGFPVPAGVVVPAAAFTANAAEGAPDALPPALLEELYELVESISHVELVGVHRNGSVRAQHSDLGPRPTGQQDDDPVHGVPEA